MTSTLTTETTDYEQWAHDFTRATSMRIDKQVRAHLTLFLTFCMFPHVIVTLWALGELEVIGFTLTGTAALAAITLSMLLALAALTLGVRQHDRTDTAREQCRLSLIEQSPENFERWLQDNPPASRCRVWTEEDEDDEDKG